MKLMSKAVPVWGENLTEKYNQFFGFRADLDLKEETEVTIYLAARTYYRLYINGEMVMNGPARTAAGYCRIDELKRVLKGKVKLAIEVDAYSTSKRYCNDNTMEPGALAVEVYGKKIASECLEKQEKMMEDEKAAGTLLTCTGDENWHYTELTYRAGMVELMSHSRGIIEYYRLKPDSLNWTTAEINKGAEKVENEENTDNTDNTSGGTDNLVFRKPVQIAEKITFLKRRSPYPTYERIPFCKLEQVTEMKQIGHVGEDEMISLVEIVKPNWKYLLPEENKFLEELQKESDTLFRGKYKRIQNTPAIAITESEGNPAATFSLEKSEVGFLHLQAAVEEKTTLDLINSDYLDEEGALKANTYICRFELEPGEYNLMSMEPKLCKYVKVVARTKGKVVFTHPELLNYTYPDEENNTFRCSDGDINNIYEAAKRTLRLNTLDIFMDCPERERGGWLCDSYFSGYAAWQLFGDHRVEKDFMENFFLTDGKAYRDGFFPEVYPGIHADEADPGIESWSFWLLAELYSYVKRSGDREFADCHYKRIETFLNGVETHLGESGLFEHFTILFVDWSLSNHKICLEPISMPVNCLIVCAYELMGELYQNQSWIDLAAAVRKRIEAVWAEAGTGSDGYGYEIEENENNCSKVPDISAEEYSAGLLESTEMNNSADATDHRQKNKTIKFTANGVRTESGAALELWSGFHKDDKRFIKAFLCEMGPCPAERPNPNVGGANLFIGLMIRFEVLARMGKIQQLFQEMKSVYLPQLKEGQGTLFEGIQERKGCHGFNGMAGALIADRLLGLGSPNQENRTVTLSPHPGNCKWAYGKKQCQDGEISLRWAADHMEHKLEMEAELPEGWNAEIVLPIELSGWKVLLNHCLVKVIVHR